MNAGRNGQFPLQLDKLLLTKFRRFNQRPSKFVAPDIKASDQRNGWLNAQKFFLTYANMPTALTKLIRGLKFGRVWVGRLVSSRLSCLWEEARARGVHSRGIEARVLLSPRAKRRERRQGTSQMSGFISMNYSWLPITRTFKGNWKRFELSRVKLYRTWPERKGKLVRVSARFELWSGVDFTQTLLHKW